MASNAEKALELFKKRVGTTEGPGDWHRVDQDQINLFADATLDHQFIHVDVERAKKGPFGAPIAHGFLTLSLLTHLQSTIKVADPAIYAGLAAGINYGFDKVRFVSPVKVDSQVRASRELTSVEAANPSTLQVKQKVTVEIEGESRPACVAEWITRLVYA
jgi:acyl dehydratase